MGGSLGLRIASSRVDKQFAAHGVAAASEQRYLMDSNILSSLGRWCALLGSASGIWQSSALCERFSASNSPTAEGHLESSTTLIPNSILKRNPANSLLSFHPQP